MALPKAKRTQSASTVEAEEWVASWSSASVSQRDGVPSERLFEALAKRWPVRLLDKMFSGDLSNGHLALAAEVAGRDAPAFLAEPALIALLDDHDSPTVREGCVLGLTGLLRTHRHAEAAVRRHADSRFEPSAAVRETALESLAVLDE